jgi:RimJ/RimL family protein N-acetyltransferase
MMNKPIFVHDFAGGRAANPPTLVRELDDTHRAAVLRHFLTLEADDRHLRFGSPTSDAVIKRYVANLAFSRDALFGVFNDALDLVGIAHLAYVPPEKDSLRSAEFGVSVLHHSRHRSLGAALLARAAVHARNTHIDTLFVHCLAKNKAMMHLAQKLGMRVEFAYGDADAYLILPPANAQSILHEASQEQMADLDYALKANLKQSKQIWRWFFGMQSQP